jgi:putative MATE family efflux protein
LAKTIKKENIERILHHPSILKGIVIMAIPVFLNNILKSLHDLVDAIFISRMDAPSQSILDAGLAAVNIHWPVFSFFMALGTGLSVATIAMLSQYVGLNRKDLARGYASKLVLLSVVLALVVTLIFFLTSDQVVGYNLFAYLMGARDEALVFAGRYFRIRSYEFVFVFVFVVYTAIRQATGETLFPVILNIIAILINIVLTWYFIIILKMGVEGAAYATLIAHILPMPIIIYDLFKSKKHLTISFNDMKFNIATLSEMNRFAVPAAIGQAISSLGFMVVQSVIIRYGNYVSAGFSVGNRISSLLLNPVVAISSVTAAFIGLNIGHAQPERAHKSYQIAKYMSLAISVFGAALIIPFRFSIIELILGTNESEAYQIAGIYTVWVLLTQPFMALFQSYVTLFNGSGHSHYTLKMAMLRLWGIRVPLVLLAVFLLPKDDYRGVFWAMMLSNIVIIFYGHHLKKNINYEVQVRI